MTTKASSQKSKQNHGIVKSLSRFRTVKRLKKTSNQWINSLQDARHKLVKTPIDDAKSLITDLKKSPRKTIDRLVDDGRKQFADFNQATRRKIDRLAQDGKKIVGKAGKEPVKTINSVIDDGKQQFDKLQKNTIKTANDLMKDFEKDARLAADDLMAFSARQIDRIPGKKNAEAQIRRRMQAVPAQFNLPSKTDMDNLMNGVKQLTVKVDTLNKQHAV